MNEEDAEFLEQHLERNKHVEKRHFKVMRLRVHEDTHGLSQCDVLFQFYFDLMRQ